MDVIGPLVGDRTGGSRLDEDSSFGTSLTSRVLPIHAAPRRPSPPMTTSPPQRRSRSLHWQTTGRSPGLQAEKHVPFKMSVRTIISSSLMTKWASLLPTNNSQRYNSSHFIHISVSWLIMGEEQWCEHICDHQHLLLLVIYPCRAWFQLRLWLALRPLLLLLCWSLSGGRGLRGHKRFDEPATQCLIQHGICWGESLETKQRSSSYSTGSEVSPCSSSRMLSGLTSLKRHKTHTSTSVMT